MGLEGVLSHHTLFTLYPDLPRDLTYYWVKPDGRKREMQTNCPNCKRGLTIRVQLEHGGRYVGSHKTLDEEKACGFLQYLTQGARP